MGDRVELMLDTNCPWPVDEAIRIGRELEPHHLRWPSRSRCGRPKVFAGLARVRATVQLIAAAPGVPFIEMPPGELEAPILAEPIRCEGRVVTVSERPGLGADPNPDVLTRYPYRGSAARRFYLT